MQSLRPDEVKGHVKKLDEEFGDVVVRVAKCGYREPPSLARAMVGQQLALQFAAWMVLVFAESDPSWGVRWTVARIL